MGSIEVQFFEKDQVLFEAGDDADYFFIIMWGKVDLYLPNQAHKKFKSEISTLERQIKIMENQKETYLKNLQRSKLQQIELEELQKEIKLSKLKLHFRMKEFCNMPSKLYQMSYGAGDSFGEKAFLERGTRAGTCIANEQSFCLTVQKDQYINLVKHIKFSDGSME